MTKLIYSTTILILLMSCKHKNAESQKSDKISPIEDPNLFIGKHKIKAIVLGVFHFSNPGLSSYKSSVYFSVLEKKTI